MNWSDPLRINRKLAAVAATGALALVTPAAFADVVYNNLDGSIDSQLETMTLHYDSTNQVGQNGSTILTLQVQGHDDGDHSGCNIQGARMYIQLAATYDASVVSVSLSNNGVIEACQSADGTVTPIGSQITATVTSLALGSTDVTFSEAAGNYPDEGQSPYPRKFSYDEAAFHVDVVEGTIAGTGCDVDPAAPAWAAAILKASGVKAYSKDWNNAIAYVTKFMGTGATYHGIVKNAHSAYEQAVDADLVGYFLGKKTIASVDDAKVIRPGWTCLQIS